MPDSSLLEALKNVGLDRYAGREMLDSILVGGGANFSGGEKKRICFARALIRETNVLILDEPLSGVDVEGQIDLMDMLDELRTQYDLSIFLTTHDFATLEHFADKVVLLNKQVLKAGKPGEVLSSPEFYQTFHLRMGKGGEA